MTLPILVVEDSNDDFKAMMRGFKKTNLVNHIYRCEDGQEALDYLYHQGKYNNPVDAPKPSIILLDLNLPGLDGRKFLKKIKSNDDLMNIPVIVLTTSDDERDIEDCYRNGANTYIQKPVDLDKLFEAIKQLKDYWFGIAILPKEKK